MTEPKSPFLPTKEELKILDKKDGFDRTQPDPVVNEVIEETTTDKPANAE